MFTTPLCTLLVLVALTSYTKSTSAVTRQNFVESASDVAVNDLVEVKRSLRSRDDKVSTKSGPDSSHQETQGEERLSIPGNHIIGPTIIKGFKGLRDLKRFLATKLYELVSRFLHNAGKTSSDIRQLPKNPREYKMYETIIKIMEELERTKARASA
ncbi:hypothetical protein PsorP6_009850 [Peronosclerospora sorghi]|uniref:Uncharacterized protein n=1 Tax=Peronosclerospora sorghi TaxID=230839 RepID=A0ACC0VYL4_9STRA|nr:hypothetical protein PsorP6_009850 [Peronosclerospora sorghi]